jgi:thiol-disulfide isomerase/thioredoxin
MLCWIASLAPRGSRGARGSRLRARLLRCRSQPVKRVCSLRLTTARAAIRYLIGSPRSARIARAPLRIGAVLAAMLMLAACTSTGADEQTRSAGQVGYPQVQGNLTRVPPGQRKELPAVSGPALDDRKPISTQDYRGKVVVINVWGSWCPPCRKEAPDLQAASVETKDIAQFVGITSKDYDPAPAEAFVRSFKITYPSIYDPSGKVLLAFSGDLPPSAIPSTLIIDRQGRLAVRVLSEVSKITLVDMINDVADGR